MYSLFFVEETESTNDEVLKYQSKNQDIVGLYTTYQKKGRGQYGNTWQMPKNENIAYTVMVKANLISIQKVLLNFHIAVIVRNFLEDKLSEKVQMKWPNDIIINRKKIVGILVENLKVAGEDYYIIGMGVNVLQKDFGELSKAGSIFTQTGEIFCLRDFTEELHQYFTENIIKENPNILDEYNKYLFNRDKVASFVKRGIRQNGIIQYVDNNGYLWVNLENDGLESFFHKEIEMEY